MHFISLISTALFCLYTCTTAQAARPCTAGLTHHTAVVERVIDGDTLVLDTQQKVRLLGVDTYEINSQSRYDKHWAQQAATALDKRLSGQTVVVSTERDTKDRYGRLLAHISAAPDDTDAGQFLLEQGLARAVAVGRNTACAEDNQQLEQQSRRQRRGLWGDFTIDKSTQRDVTRLQGFHILRSKVVEQSETGRNVTLMLRNGLHVKLGRYWPESPAINTLFSDLVGKHIEVRGWITTHRGMARLILHHPANLLRLDH